MSTQHYDVIVVGAGLSGIGAGYRLQEMCPGMTYTILEARDTIGGTWDLFRYPGVRSDSDMFTLGYPFRPWPDPRSIADGASILTYVQDTASEFGIDEHIQLGHKVVAASWASDDARWTLTVERSGAADNGSRTTLTARFVYFCGGYYDYERGYDPHLPGRDTFRGRVVHPQFWPDDLDHAGRRVVVIGSGATAVTIVPAMAGSAEHVTMVQRSPSYIVSLPSVDRRNERLQRWLPGALAHRVLRTVNMLLTLGFYQYCRRFPARARRYLIARVRRSLRGAADVDPHFQPSYDPWDQRLCLVPDSDFFRAVRQGRATVVTGTIERIVPEGVQLSSGEVIAADLLVTATGLSLVALGGAAVDVDGEPVDLGSRFSYRGLMISGVPNAAFCIGYINASWTLRADLSSTYVCRLLRHLDRHGHAAATPTPRAPMDAAPLLGLMSGYVRRSVGDFPKQGEADPWRTHQNYLRDLRTLRMSSLTTDMCFTRRGEPVPTEVPSAATRVPS